MASDKLHGVWSTDVLVTAGSPSDSMSSGSGSGLLVQNRSVSPAVMSTEADSGDELDPSDLWVEAPGGVLPGSGSSSGSASGYSGYSSDYSGRSYFSPSGSYVQGTPSVSPSVSQGVSPSVSQGVSPSVSQGGSPGVFEPTPPGSSVMSSATPPTSDLTYGSSASKSSSPEPIPADDRRKFRIHEPIEELPRRVQPRRAVQSKPVKSERKKKGDRRRAERDARVPVKHEPKLKKRARSPEPEPAPKKRVAPGKPANLRQLLAQPPRVAPKKGPNVRKIYMEANKRLTARPSSFNASAQSAEYKRKRIAGRPKKAADKPMSGHWGARALKEAEGIKNTPVVYRIGREAFVEPYANLVRKYPNALPREKARFSTVEQRSNSKGESIRLRFHPKWRGA